MHLGWKLVSVHSKDINVINLILLNTHLSMYVCCVFLCPCLFVSVSLSMHLGWKLVSVYSKDIYVVNLI